MTERVVMYSKSLLGKRIKEIRKSKGFTQELLAESAGIDSKHLSRIECGVNFPSLDLLNKIAVLLNIEPSLLFQTGHLKDKTDIIKEINDTTKVNSYFLNSFLFKNSPKAYIKSSPIPDITPP